MSTRHVVAQGEFLASIALKHGFRNWRVIWDHPENAALKQRRKNPNVLSPGDELVIPDRTEGTAAAATGQLTTFETGTNDVLLNLTFENASAKALGGRSGQLTVGGRSVNGDLVKKGPLPLSTDPAGTLPLVFRNVLDGKLAASEGAFAFDPLPPPAPGGVPPEPAPPAFRFLVGDLDPVDTPSGQRARLNNLGYFAGFSDRDEDQLAWAIEEFQADEKLADRGLKGSLATDRPSLNRLAQRHGDMLKGEELMSDIFIPDFVEETSAGIFARHPARATLPVLTAPTTPERAAATNRVREHLVTVACSNLADGNFAFDSSVMNTGMAQGMKSLAKLVALYPGSPLTLFGHADPEGPSGTADSYNKFLSERRARAVYALLLRRTDIWEQLHSDAGERQHVAGDDWGLRSLQLMLDALTFTPGNLDGKPDKLTDEALADFVGKATGTRPARAKNDAPTRALLFRAYMDFLCPDDPARPGGKFELGPERFLNGAKGKIEGPGDFQGCSAFNLQLILAKEELDALGTEGDIGKATRHGLNEPNRRVIIFLFAPGTVMPANWPCPSAKKGVAGCHARFWSDGEQRRGTRFPQHRRRFGKAVPEPKAVLVPDNPGLATRMRKPETTFACRFYHGMAIGSPCERDLKMWVLRLHAGGPTRPIANAHYVARLGTDEDAPLIRGTTTASGTLALPVYDDVVTISLRIDAFRLLFGTLPLPPKPNDPPAPPPPPATSTDPEAFPDEDQFVEVILNAGALDRIRLPAGAEPAPAGPGDAPPVPDFDSEDAPPLTPDERDRGAGERLQNLAFGDRELILDAAARRQAITSFQRFVMQRPPDKATGVLDDETIDRLAREYGDARVTEKPPA